MRWRLGVALIRLRKTVSVSPPHHHPGADLRVRRLSGRERHRHGARPRSIELHAWASAYVYDSAYSWPLVRGLLGSIFILLGHRRRVFG